MISSKKRRERGQALVEFALVATIFFMMLFGIFDMTRLLQSSIAIQHSSREAARYAITGREDCDGANSRQDCIIWTAEKSTVGLFGGGPSGADVSVSVKAWDYEGNDWSVGAVDGASGKQCDQLEVTVTYEHQFVTPIMKAIVPGGISIHGSQRMTNEPFGPCQEGDGVS